MPPLLFWSAHFSFGMPFLSQFNWWTWLPEVFLQGHITFCCWRSAIPPQFFECPLFSFGMPFFSQPNQWTQLLQVFCKATSVAAKDFLSTTIYFCRLHLRFLDQPSFSLGMLFPQNAYFLLPTQQLQCQCLCCLFSVMVFFCCHQWGGWLFLIVQCNNQLVWCQFIVASCCLFAASCCCGISYCWLIAAFLPPVADVVFVTTTCWLLLHLLPNPILLLFMWLPLDCCLFGCWQSIVANFLPPVAVVAFASASWLTVAALVATLLYFVIFPPVISAVFVTTHQALLLFLSLLIVCCC